MAYNHSIIERKWQHYWKEHKTFKTYDDTSKPKYYALDMFPYPSGQGLHVGHPEGYTATDIISRMKRMQGYNVLHPMVGTPLVCLQNNMLLKQGITQRILLPKTLKPSSAKFGHLVFHMTGIVRLTLPIQAITSGPNGFLNNSTKKRFSL